MIERDTTRILLKRSPRLTFIKLGGGGALAHGPLLFMPANVGGRIARGSDRYMTNPTSAPPTLTYDPQKEFARLILAAALPSLVAVSSSVPVKALKELNE